jgi:hypothetical protein
MNGPEHYREAEKILRRLQSDPRQTYDHHVIVEGMAVAQVHATLALAAAAVASAELRGESR